MYNKGTTTHATKSSVHGLGCQPLVTGGKSLPSNHAAAQRELAAMRRQHRAKEDMGGQPRDTDGRSLPSDAAKDKQPRIGELRAKHARGCQPSEDIGMASASDTAKKRRISVKTGMASASDGTRTTASATSRSSPPRAATRARMRPPPRS